MKDTGCVEFLQWCLPRLRMRWSGFRKVRRQVCKRIGRRLAELELTEPGLAGPGGYRSYIETHPGEWDRLDAMCRVTISRFYRDRGVFDALSSTILPSLARSAVRRAEPQIRCWCAGCASGEEAYTIRIVWTTCIDTSAGAVPPLSITATETDTHLLERAREGRYTASSLRELPAELLEGAFERRGGHYSVRAKQREGIRFIEQDIRRELPPGPFHIVLCRNLVFTYFDESLQLSLVRGIAHRLARDGILIVGSHERLPEEMSGVFETYGHPCIYRKLA